MMCRAATNEDIVFLSYVIMYQFLVDISDYLDEIRNSLRVCVGSTGRIRRVLLNNKLMATLRASDYHLIPYNELAKVLHSRIPFPKHRLIIANEMVPDVLNKSTIFCRHVIQCDYSCRAGDEVFVVDEQDSLLGVATLKLDCETIITALRGAAALPRFWCR